MGAPPDKPPGPAAGAGAGQGQLRGVGDDKKRLGRFTLVHELASGGMATLFLARAAGPAGFEKVVAIKRIHPHLSKQRYFVQMFLDEARLAARIQHPNVVQIYELGEYNNDYFIAMEYVEGESLARLAAQARKIQKQKGGDSLLPMAEAASIVAEAAAGLHAAHELRGPDGAFLNVVHRDVSPHNVLITYDGHVKLVDFGVAKARGRVTHTVGGQLKGKIAYMSPEQVENQELDRRSDIFSLGTVLFEVTCSRRLFKDKSEVGSIQRIVNGKVPPPSKVVPGYPKELEAVVMRALARKPEQRFQTAEEMSRAINKALTSMGHAIQSGDVSNVMHATFPDRIQLKAKLREASESTDPSTAAVLSELSNSQTLDFSPPSINTGSDGTVAVIREAIEVRRRRTWRAALIAFVVTAAATLSTYPFLKDKFSMAEVGTLRVDSHPDGAEIFLDRKGPLAKTAAKLENVPLGEHRLAVRLDGYQLWERKLTLKTPGQEIIVEAALRKVADTVDDATGDAGPGKTAADAGGDAGVDAGRIDAAAKAKDAAKDKPKRRDKPRNRAPGLLTLKTVPWAEVWLGGRRLGETPLVGIKLPAGTHTLRLRPEGRRPGKTLRIRIRPGRHVRQEVNLR